MLKIMILFLEIKKINLSNAIYFDGNEINFDFLKFYIAELRLKQKKILTVNIRSVVDYRTMMSILIILDQYLIIF